MAVASDDHGDLNVVIIHAYHYGYNWTYNNNEGAREVILEAYPDANIYTEFLDWKRFPEQALLNQKVDEFQIKYKDIDVDLLLTTDDMGLAFALAHRADLFNEAPVAFSGIIEHTAYEIIGDEQDVTGVYESMSPEGAYELVRLLQPEVQHLIFIHDLSESGLRTSEVFKQAAEIEINASYTFEDWHDKPFYEIIKDVSLLEADSAIMFFSYSRSSDGIVKSAETFAKEISEASTVPMYSNAEELLGNGITGGTFLSGVLQGGALGNLGVQILAGEDPDNIPHVSEATVYSGVDEVQLRRFHLEKDLLPLTVVIYNERFSFIKAYWRLVLGTGVILLGLVALIAVLVHHQLALRFSRNEVLGQTYKLQGLYEKLQGSEEELRVQNEKMENHQEHLEFQAFHDHLTGLPNRVSLNLYVKKLFTKVNAAGRKAVVVFIDLDNFKFVNNTYGHKFGDDVLVNISERLSTLHEGVFAARIGGDEFVIIKDYEPELELKLINDFLKRVDLNISRPMHIGEEQVIVKASIGFSIYPDDGGDYDQLIVEADTAMLQAKKDGKAKTRKYKEGMSHAYQNEYIMIKSLKDAYANDEFYLVYQPIMIADGSKVASFEALVRWKSPDHGQVPPNVFVPLAETSGLMIPIGYYIIDQALAFAKDICKSPEDMAVVSINISVVQFYEEDFVQVLLQKISDIGLQPNNIQIEITESVMIESYSWLIEKLVFLREKGIFIALDDFGTGYSSLAYLHKLPIDKLKIDKEFVDDIVDEFTKTPLIDATITLASSFGMEVVAEGVELQGQLNYLRRKGCSLIQGYYFSRPLSREDALAYCGKWCGNSDETQND